MGRRRKKHSGHYCWSCDRYRANERFNGRGHGRHLCRDCQKLGAAELTYRQHVRNIERCLTDEGTVRRKCRRMVERFLEHEDLRLRAWAQELLTKRIPIDFDEPEYDDYDEIEPSYLFSEDTIAPPTSRADREEIDALLEDPFV